MAPLHEHVHGGAVGGGHHLDVGEDLDHLGDGGEHAGDVEELLKRDVLG